MRSSALAFAVTWLSALSLGLIAPTDAKSATIWPLTTVPAVEDVGADSPVELGVRFRSDSSGYITGIRFHKASANTGTHVGNLWTSSGALLATATFTNETPSGWQQVAFSTPVAISADTFYVASYHTNVGHYSDDYFYFDGKGVDNAPLHAPADGSPGLNGVYAYGSASSFPNQSWKSSNYWVDVVFTAGVQPDTASPIVTSFTVPSAASALTVSITSFTATDDVGVTGYLVNESSSAPPAGAAGWSATAPTAYTFATAGSKTLYAWARDAAGNVSASRTALVSISAVSQNSIWPLTTVPAVEDAGADSPVELGVRFRSDSSGYITGIRFHKASANTGTHVGNLWTSSGALLATATFTNETPSGWQQVAFPTPVAISADTFYVASYHTNVGHYSDDYLYFDGKGVDNAPLHAPADGSPGLNGVYAYGSTSSFPNQSWKSSNYWVDVVFTAGVQPDTASPIVTAFTVPSAASALTVSITSFTATDDVGVTGYLVNESSSAPPAGAAGWSATAPTAYTFATAGSKTLYAWARDAAGNVSASMNALVAVILPDTTPPTVTSFTVPASASTLTTVITAFTAADNVGVTGYLVKESSSTPSATAAGWSASAPTAYTFATAGSKTLYAWAKDAAGNVSARKSASVAVTLPAGGPILIISSDSNPFSSYYAEILRAEGFCEFAVSDITSLTSAQLNSYDVAILGEFPLTASQVSIIESWVNAGGKLISMRPDKKLADLLGLSDLAATISDAYLLVDPASGPGQGIVNQTIQYHGPADVYSLNGASTVATIYYSATTATSNPAVTLRVVGTNGGQAAAYTYDLARSVIYTRQGNPAWAGQERDGFAPIRSDDLFFGAASFDPKPDWVDLNKVAIPQADEQQRLLANLIISMNFQKKPLPRFWYFPRTLPAVVVMTGDDHANGGTSGRFETYKSMSPSGCSVADWECVRSTSYIYSATPLTNAQASAYNSAGFEVALHVNTNCADWTPSTLQAFFSNQLSAWKAKYSSLPAPVTHRIHCLTWSDYGTLPAVQFSNGITLDTNYYYWPPNWATSPGFFTGSGIPMRFSDSSGNLINVYQAPTQMTDESGQSYPFTINALLDNAIGPEGYYGAFVANIHTDAAVSVDSDEIIRSAQARGIPVVSARQMLEWLEGRNGSTFKSFDWNGNTLSFSITAAAGASGLTAMVPIPAGQLAASVTADGNPVSFKTITIKGIAYATFAAASGTYLVTYGTSIDTVPPTASLTAPLYGTTLSDTVAVTAIATDDVAVTRVEFYLNGVLQATDWSSPYKWSWNTAQTGNGAHTISVKAYDAAGNIGTSNSATVTVSNSVPAIFLIQKASSSTSDGRTLTAVLPANVTGGNLIAVSVSGWPNIPASAAVTDSIGNAYSLAGNVLTTNGAFTAIYYAKNVTGGANTVTFNAVNSGTQISMAVAEFSGVDQTAPLDRTSGATGSGTTPSSGTMTPSAAGGLVIGSGTHNATTATETGPGFTLIAVPTEESAMHQPLAMEYLVLGGAQATAAAFILGTSTTWAQNGAIFKRK